jgi:hypothetical protein
VKDEGDNLSIHAQAFTLVVSCGPLGLVVPWKGSCFGHAFSKLCQYVCNDTKIYVGFREVSLKPLNLHYQKKEGLRSLAKGVMNAIRHVLMLGFPIENKKNSIKPSFATKVILD